VESGDKTTKEWSGWGQPLLKSECAEEWQGDLLQWAVRSRSTYTVVLHSLNLTSTFYLWENFLSRTAHSVLKSNFVTTITTPMQPPLLPPSPPSLLLSLFVLIYASVNPHLFAISTIEAETCLVSLWIKQSFDELLTECECCMCVYVSYISPQDK